MTFTAAINSFRKGLNTEGVAARVVERKALASGWRVGKSVSANRCPKCFNAAKFSAIRKAKQAREQSMPVITNMSEISNKLSPLSMKVSSETAPRTMGREDRRLIFEKLNDVYVDEKIGFSNGWSDAKVAEDLGVPRAWVAQLRDENFGPEGASQEIRAQIAEAKALLLEIKTVQGEMANVRVLFQKLESRADKIEKTLIAIEGGLR